MAGIFVLTTVSEKTANTFAVPAVCLSMSYSDNKYIIPINHDLENWGDFNTRTGVYNLQQPVIAPLYDTRQKEAILLTWLSGKPETYTEDIYHKYLMDRWLKDVYPIANPAVEFRKFWLSCLHDGFFEANNGRSASQPQFKLPSISNGPVKKDFTVILSRNYTVGDGRFAGNGWIIILFLIQMTMGYGLTLHLLCYGTYLQLQLISRSLQFSGM